MTIMAWIAICGLAMSVITSITVASWGLSNQLARIDQKLIAISNIVDKQGGRLDAVEIDASNMRGLMKCAQFDDVPCKNGAYRA